MHLTNLIGFTLEISPRTWDSKSVNIRDVYSTYAQKMGEEVVRDLSQLIKQS